MSNMSVTVEFLPGTDIKDAIEEAHQKAVMWDVAYVCFKFNGVSVSVRQHENLPWSEVIIAGQKVVDAVGTKLPHVIV